MAFLSSMNIAASGLTAQRLRLDIAAENIVNIDTTRTEKGGPYRRKVVVFEEMNDSKFKNVLSRAMGYNNENNGGVRVAAVSEDMSSFKSVYDPTHPDADANGYVLMPNVDLVKETIDSMAATRAYEANVTAFNAIKLMAGKALDIGK